MMAATIRAGAARVAALAAATTLAQGAAAGPQFPTRPRRMIVPFAPGGSTDLKRSPVAADVPTFDESGYKGFEVDHLQGALVPAGTPRPIVERLSAEIRRAIDSPEVR